MIDEWLERVQKYVLCNSVSVSLLMVVILWLSVLYVIIGVTIDLGSKISTDRKKKFSINSCMNAMTSVKYDSFV